MIGSRTIWSAAALAPVVGLLVGREVSLVDALLGFGLVAVVPLAFALHGLSARRGLAAVGCGATASVALTAHPTTRLAVALGLPWLVLAFATAAHVASRWLRESPGWRQAGGPLVFGYLAFAACALVAHLAGARPLGFAPPFIELAAVHFSFAGFVAGTIAIRAHRRVGADRPRVSAVMVTSVLGGTPVVAAGFGFSPVLQMIGAVLLLMGLVSLSWLTVRCVVAAEPDRVAARLLAASAAVVPVAMLLAVWWSVGSALGLPAPSIALMARTHGVLNGVGLSFLGVLGWRRVEARPQASMRL